MRAVKPLHVELLGRGESFFYEGFPCSGGRPTHMNTGAALTGLGRIPAAKKYNLRLGGGHVGRIQEKVEVRNWVWI